MAVQCRPVSSLDLFVPNETARKHCIYNWHVVSRNSFMGRWMALLHLPAALRVTDGHSGCHTGLCFSLAAPKSIWLYQVSC